MNLIRSCRFVAPALLAALGVSLLLVGTRSHADDLPPAVAEAEAKRIEVVKKVQPAVVAVFAPGGMNGGSGVLIDEDGFALTNFHVVEACGVTMQCGLADGVLYDGVVVGIDKVGDVALIKLLPKTEGQKFPYAKMGDSRKVRAGDWSFAMGNPFLLATDFTPTVTFGLVSGTNRYQYPAGLLLEYTACIQIDTSINPGNSGGPLFNLDGELIGINGRGSFEKRGRVNSGVGYAISINQIKNFEWHLRAGLQADHASTGFIVAADEEEGSVGKLTVQRIIDTCDAARRGIDIDDEIVYFAGEPLPTINQYKNVLGMYPRGWRMPLRFRHTDDKKKTETHDVLVRLMGVLPREIKDPDKADEKQPPGVKPPPRPQPTGPGLKFYEAKSGFANYYFNRKMRDQLVKDFTALGNFHSLKGKWVLEGTANVLGRSQPFQAVLEDEKLTMTLDRVEYSLNPAMETNAKTIMNIPDGSGGLLMALHHYRQLLVMPAGPKTFEADYSHGGREPFYLLQPEGAKPDFMAQRLDTNVLRTNHAGITAKWYFALHDQPRAGLRPNYLAGFELSVDPDLDPCEIFLSDYKPEGGRQFPHKIEVKYGDVRYGTFTVEKVQMSDGK